MKTIQQLMSLEGRVALITGGAGHIGQAIAETFCEIGAQVAILDSNAKSLQECSKNLKQKFKTEILELETDLANENSIRKAPEAILKKWKRLDIVVNCAAFVGNSNLKGWATPFLEQSSSTFSDALEINLSAAFTLTQACTPALRESGHGSVVNVSSIYGCVGPNLNLYEGTSMGNPAGYAASKGGLIQLTRWLSTVLAPVIRVNCISPGGVARNQPEAFVQKYIERTPLKRMATEEDFKGVIAFLASDLSNYVTGQNIVVDGGWTAW